MPSGGQYIHVFGTKGAVDLMGAAMMYPLGRDGQPAALAEKTKDAPHAHIAAFYECVRSGAANPADIVAGATAALTAILGHEAMTKGQTVRWSDMGVSL